MKVILQNKKGEFFVSNKVNYLDEAKKLVEIIDPTKIKKQDNYIFFISARARTEVDGFFTDKQIFWLRDIWDRQLED